ncbi:MAG: hypothetical protein HSCHL_1171 [Hydrogenibacillus schlegelii]|uniref:Uncharacterized protein n=1 Tax=Hydrogenibacillus schlegelii TaxID=1484 RepID=A0A2T5G6J5_HYDSH|nr:MAG: hypothetical protein HSCHL_1171 [Hydrogenibacillus schlegelii]
MRKGESLTLKPKNFVQKLKEQRDQASKEVHSISPPLTGRKGRYFFQ